MTKKRKPLTEGEKRARVLKQMIEDAWARMPGNERQAFFERSAIAFPKRPNPGWQNLQAINEKHQDNLTRKIAGFDESS